LKAALDTDLVFVMGEIGVKRVEEEVTQFFIMVWI